jgi:hypothetical protein
MKHILIAIPYFILAVASILLGFITWLWTFKSDDFFKGSRFINSRVGFTSWWKKYC